jgi:hypothetical protein
VINLNDCGPTFIELSNSKNAPLPSVAIPISSWPNCKNERVNDVLNRVPPFLFEDKNERGESLNPFQFTNGTIYEGEWKDGMKHGQGKQIWIDGTLYEGSWKNNVAHGRGRLIHADGDIYEGDWENDKVNGKVKIISLYHY